VPTGGVSSVTTGGDADTVFHAFNQALQGHDLTAFKATLCADVRDHLDEIPQSSLDQVNSVTEVLTPSASGTGVGKVVVNVTVNGAAENQPFDVTIVDEGGSCVQSFAFTGSDSSSSGSSGPTGLSS
jgi:hypothetical protein